MYCRIPVGSIRPNSFVLVYSRRILVSPSDRFVLLRSGRQHCKFSQIHIYPFLLLKLSHCAKTKRARMFSLLYGDVKFNWKDNQTGAGSRSLSYSSLFIFLVKFSFRGIEASMAWARFHVVLVLVLSLQSQERFSPGLWIVYNRIKKTINDAMFKYMQDDQVSNTLENLV